MSNKPKPNIPNQARKNPNGALSQREITVSQHYQGPIPNADELAKYEHLHPGLAERIVAMAELEQTSRIELRKNSSEGVFDIEKRKIAVMTRGQWFSMFAIVLLLALAAFMVWKGAALVAFGTIGIAGGIIWAFMGIRKNGKETK